MPVRPVSSSLTLPLLLLSLPGCRDSTAPVPSDPRLYASVAVGAQHSCGVRRDGSLDCWGRGVGRAPVPLAPASTFRSAGVGVSTACGLATDGRVHCWDTWDAGRSAGEAPDATVLDTDLRFADLAVGWGHMCGLTAAGDLYCWGANLYGAVGTGSTEAVVAVPTMVASDVTFTAVAAGVSHTCAIADGGEVWCWGETWSGAVGAPGGEMCGASPGRTCTRSPLRVAGGHRFRQMAAGGGHTCGIDESGELLCWGLGHDGQLGHAPTGLCGMTVADLACSPAPTAVSGGLRWSAVSATSARTCAVAEDGGAWCWGRGELGDGTWAGSAVPRSVDVDTRFARIATGMDHSCGVGVDGVVWCWGMNTYGQIGDGSPSMGWPAPVAVRFFESG